MIVGGFNVGKASDEVRIFVEFVAFCFGSVDGFGEVGTCDEVGACGEVGTRGEVGACDEIGTFAEIVIFCFECNVSVENFG